VGRESPGVMLGGAMRALGSQTAAAVIALTALVCVVVIAGNGPLRAAPEPYTPSRGELADEIGAVNADFPVPGALPPEVFPPEVWAARPPGLPAWLLWALGTIGVAVAVVLGLQLVRGPMDWRWWRSIGWQWWRLGRRRRRRAAPAASSNAGPAQAERVDEAEVARHAVDAALVPLREPADPRAAVIDAYARMEEVLAGRQLGRQTPEAPREYLRRILREQGMPEESLTTLTALFEEARFSRRPIPRSAPRRAASELQIARVALAEPNHLEEPA
jgi:hypothetical protein